MWNKKVILLSLVIASAGLLFPTALSGQTLEYTQTDPTFEAGARVAAGIEKSVIPKTLTFSLDEQLRVNGNFSHFQRSYTTLGADYRLLPWLKTGLSYSLIVNNSSSNGWGLRHRGAFSLTETARSGRLKIAFREKIQATYRADSMNVYQSPRTTWVLKTRVKASYDLRGSRFTPYASAEVRFLLNGANPAYFVYDSYTGRMSNTSPVYNDVYFNRLRINLGSTYKTPRRNTLDFYIVGDLCYDLDIDFNSKGKQKKSSLYNSGYAPYMYLSDSYFVGAGFAYTFKL